MRAHADAVVDRAATAASPRARASRAAGDREGPFGYAHVNVADQRRDPSSLLNWIERIIRMRKEVPRDRLGRLRRCSTTGDPDVLALRYDWRNNAVLFLHNFDGKAARR